MVNERLSSKAQEQIGQYHSLLYAWSEKLNLISPRDREKIKEKHIRPALRMATLIKVVPHRVILDLGSGAGLPGIPIKIAHPESEVFLVESRRKRANFLREVIRRLGLRDITVVNSRVEDWERPQDRQVDLVVSRAVSSVGQIASWVEPVLKPSGYIITSMGTKEGRASLPVLYEWNQGEKGHLGIWRG